MTTVAVNMINQFQNLSLKDKQAVAEKINYEIERERVVSELDMELEKGMTDIRENRTHTSDEVWTKLEIQK